MSKRFSEWFKRFFNVGGCKAGHAWAPYGYCVRCDEPHPALGDEE